MFSSLACLCIAQAILTQEQRDNIESRIFEPMLEMFTVKYAHDFDRIHKPRYLASRCRYLRSCSVSVKVP
ncbi:hypothetical protein OH492_09300 [Vibrio chagasii]|nr:hypothetical protein [Vibrio chagasii]